MVGVAETSDWYDPAVYPELRSAAPWVMEDMIQAQVMLPETLGDSLASSAPRLVEMLHAAAALASRLWCRRWARRGIVRARWR